MSPKGKNKNRKGKQSSELSHHVGDEGKRHESNSVHSAVETEDAEKKTLRDENESLRKERTELLMVINRLNDEVQLLKDDKERSRSGGDNNAMDVDQCSLKVGTSQSMMNTSGTQLLSYEDSAENYQCSNAKETKQNLSFGYSTGDKYDIECASGPTQVEWLDSKIEGKQKIVPEYQNNMQSNESEETENVARRSNDFQSDRKPKGTDREDVGPDTSYGNKSQNTYGRQSEQEWKYKDKNCRGQKHEYYQSSRKRFESRHNYDDREYQSDNYRHVSQRSDYDSRGGQRSGLDRRGGQQSRFNSRGGQRSGFDSRGGQQSSYFRYRGLPSDKVKIIEKDGDLFTAPQDHSLAHCVAADLRMGSGIAVQFKQTFKRVDELLDQRKRVGEVAIIEVDSRYIYYLITKKYSTGKPRIEDLSDSLKEMKEHVEKYKVKNIAIPRIGCGLDRLNWREVRHYLYTIFADVDVVITVYNFTVDFSQDSTPNTSKGIYVKDKLMKLIGIEKGTLLVLFGSECGYIDDVMNEFDEAYRFIHEYKVHTKQLGDIVTLIKREEMLCILIVKKHRDDCISYEALKSCLVKLRKIYKDEEYSFLGFQAFVDGNDDLTVAKITTLLKIAFANVSGEAWVCWPDEFKYIYDELHPNYGRNSITQGSLN